MVFVILEGKEIVEVNKYANTKASRFIYFNFVAIYSILEKSSIWKAFYNILSWRRVSFIFLYLYR